MFDLFGPSTSKINDALMVHSINYATIITLLVEKGIVTPEEIVAARNKATAMVDQVAAEQQEQVNREFDEKHPGVRETFGKLFGNMA